MRQECPNVEKSTLCIKFCLILVKLFFADSLFSVKDADREPTPENREPTPDYESSILSTKIDKSKLQEEDLSKGRLSFPKIFSALKDAS